MCPVRPIFSKIYSQTWNKLQNFCLSVSFKIQETPNSSLNPILILLLVTNRSVAGLLQVERHSSYSWGLKVFHPVCVEMYYWQESWEHTEDGLKSIFAVFWWNVVVPRGKQISPRPNLTPCLKMCSSSLKLTAQTPPPWRSLCSRFYACTTLLHRLSLK